MASLAKRKKGKRKKKTTSTEYLIDKANLGIWKHGKVYLTEINLFTVVVFVPLTFVGPTERTLQ